MESAGDGDVQSELRFAIAHEKISTALEKIGSLLASGVDPGAIGPDGLSPMDLAIYNSKHRLYDLMMPCARNDISGDFFTTAKSLGLEEAVGSASTSRVRYCNVVSMILFLIRVDSGRSDDVTVGIGNNSGLITEMKMRGESSIDVTIDSDHEFVFVTEMGGLEVVISNENGTDVVTEKIEDCFSKDLYGSEMGPKYHSINVSGIKMTLGTLAFWPYSSEEVNGGGSGDSRLDESISAEDKIHGKTLLIGHRGSGADGHCLHGVRENTVESFERAVVDGADYVELG
jgi:hypothetical protein